MSDPGFAASVLSAFRQRLSPGQAELLARRLFACPNVIITPHSAWYSEEATEDRKVLVAQTMIAALMGERPASVVN